MRVLTGIFWRWGSRKNEVIEDMSSILLPSVWGSFKERHKALSLIGEGNFGFKGAFSNDAFNQVQMALQRYSGSFKGTRTKLNLGRQTQQWWLKDMLPLEYTSLGTCKHMTISLHRPIHLKWNSQRLSNTVSNPIPSTTRIRVNKWDWDRSLLTTIKTATLSEERPFMADSWGKWQMGVIFFICRLFRRLLTLRWRKFTFMFKEIFFAFRILNHGISLSIRLRCQKWLILWWHDSHWDWVRVLVENRVPVTSTCWIRGLPKMLVRSVKNPRGKWWWLVAVFCNLFWLIV